MAGLETVKTIDKTIKEIRVDVNKCTGCMTCEMACSAVHALPPYSSVNPARSRIRVLVEETRDVYLPVRAGHRARTECTGRNVYVLDGKEYSECSFCPASCPSRDHFIEPDSGLPLKCDLCENLSLSEPMCVQVCHPGALTYHERQVESEPMSDPSRQELANTLEHLVEKYGAQDLVDAVTRKSRG